MLLMLFLPFNQRPCWDTILFYNFLCSILLMTVRINHRLLKLRCICPPHSIYRKTRMTASTIQSLRVVSPMSVFFHLRTLTPNTLLHLYIFKNKDFTCGAFYIKIEYNVKRSIKIHTKTKKRKEIWILFSFF